MKQEELNTSNSMIDVAVPNLEDETVRKAFLRKIYSNGIRKKQSVRMKERRMKQNRMLRKSLLPKNALMSLNEMKGIQISDFSIVQNTTGGGFVCSVSINNIQYEAIGQSKSGAKNFCCEKAIRDIMLQKMMSLRCLKQQQQLKDEINNENNTVEMKNDNEESMDTEDSFDEDVPMLNLASYAIHKLFCQWETEGFDVPDIVNVLGTPPVAPGSESQNDSAEVNQAAKAAKAAVGPSRSDLPEGHDTMHPATLLCMVGFIDLF